MVEVKTIQIEEERGKEKMQAIEAKMVEFLDKYGLPENFLTDQDKDDCEHDYEAMKEAAEEFLANSLPSISCPSEGYELGFNGWAVLYEHTDHQIYLTFIEV